MTTSRPEAVGPETASRPIRSVPFLIGKCSRSAARVSPCELCRHARKFALGNAVEFNGAAKNPLRLVRLLQRVVATAGPAVKQKAAPRRPPQSYATVAAGASAGCFFDVHCSLRSPGPCQSGDAVRFMRIVKVAGLARGETTTELFMGVIGMILALDQLANQLVCDLAHCVGPTTTTRNPCWPLMGRNWGEMELFNHLCRNLSPQTKNLHVSKLYIIV